MGATPDCEGSGGVVALLANTTLGWAVAGHDGWILPSWISSWSVASGVLTIEYLPRPVVVHYQDPQDIQVRFEGPTQLQLRADEAGVAELIGLAGASLP